MLNNKKLNILAVDVGNTSIHMGIFRNMELELKDKINTKSSIPSLKNFIFKLRKKAERLGINIDVVFACSVVPAINNILAGILRAGFKTKVFFCASDLIIPIKNLYKNPKAVGQDRLVNAFAGLSLYGKPIIIIDFGTAVTFDLVSKRGEYLGGIIIPGINLSLKVLGDNAALLPKVSLTNKPKSLRFIGRTTIESMFSGVVFGFSAMVQGLVKQSKSQLGANAKVILTGGDSKFIAGYLETSIDVLDEDLTLKGLNLLAQSFLRKP